MSHAGNVQRYNVAGAVPYYGAKFRPRLWNNHIRKQIPKREQA
jgi:hypothetical protein